MTFARAILAAFIGGVLAGVFLLAYKASQDNDKSIVASLTDVPDEARKVYTDAREKVPAEARKRYDDVRGRAEDVVNKGTDIVNKGKDLVQRKGDEMSEAMDEEMGETA